MLTILLEEVQSGLPGSADPDRDGAKHIYPGTTKTKINLLINILMEPFLAVYFHFVR